MQSAPATCQSPRWAVATRWVPSPPPPSSSTARCRGSFTALSLSLSLSLGGCWGVGTERRTSLSLWRSFRSLSLSPAHACKHFCAVPRVCLRGGVFFFSSFFEWLNWAYRASSVCYISSYILNVCGREPQYLRQLRRATPSHTPILPAARHYPRSVRKKIIDFTQARSGDLVCVRHM